MVKNMEVRNLDILCCGKKYSLCLVFCTGGNEQILNLQGVVIGPFCTVGPATKLGNCCQLHPGCHISGNTELGEGCVLLTWVTHRIHALLLHKVYLGERYEAFQLFYNTQIYEIWKPLPMLVHFCRLFPKPWISVRFFVYMIDLFCCNFVKQWCSCWF